MPSRRRLLAGLGTASLGALAGCPTDAPESTAEVSTTADEPGAPSTGFVWQKEITVGVPRRDGDVRTDVLRLRFERDRSRVSGGYDPTYVEAAVDGASVSVPPSVERTLRSEFGHVSYAVYLGPVDDDGGHRHARARREAFNAIPLGGRATVETYWEQAGDDSRVGYVRPTRTTPRPEPPATVEVGEFDLGDRFEEY